MTFVLPDEADGDPALAQLVVAWVTSDNWGQSRKFLTDNAAELLTESGEITLQQLIDANPEPGRAGPMGATSHHRTRARG